jgi:hypothetical protein
MIATAVNWEDVPSGGGVPPTTTWAAVVVERFEWDGDDGPNPESPQLQKTIDAAAAMANQRLLMGHTP